MGAAVETSRERGERWPALDARTMCEAFQLTAAAHPDQVALRTIKDGLRYTFREYSARVRGLAAGLHALGVRRGDTVGFMLTNRPEFHLLDTAAMHLGATPFSIYNTSSIEQIAYLLGDAGCRVAVVEAAFLERMRLAIAESQTVEDLIVLDAELDGALTVGDLERLGELNRRLRLRRHLARGRDRRRADADLHLGDHRAAEGRAADPRQRARPVPRTRRRPAAGAAAAARAVSFLPNGAHRRSWTVSLRADGLGLHDHHLPGPGAGVRPRGRRPTDAVRRRPARVGKAEGGAARPGSRPSPTSEARRDA